MPYVTDGPPSRASGLPTAAAAFSDDERARGADLDGRQVGAGHPEDGDIGEVIHTDELRDPSSPSEHDCELIGFAHHMVVGDDVPVGQVQDTAAATFTERSWSRLR